MSVGAAMRLQQHMCTNVVTFVYICCISLSMAFTWGGRTRKVRIMGVGAALHKSIGESKWWARVDRMCF
jgi:hypothetical protein